MKSDRVDPANSPELSITRTIADARGRQISLNWKPDEVLDWNTYISCPLTVNEATLRRVEHAYLSMWHVFEES